MSKPVAIVAIVAENRMIGNVDDSPLPFNVSTLMEWIFHVAGGNDGSPTPLKHSFVFGRRVYEEFMGYGIMPVGGGVNVVISSKLADKDGKPKPLPATTAADAPTDPRIMAVGSVEDALQLGTAPEAEPRPGEVCIVLGGERIYRDTMPRASLMRLSHLRRDFEGGILFPEFSLKDWKPVVTGETKTEKNEVDGEPLDYQIIDYMRVDDVAGSAALLESVLAVNEAFQKRSPEAPEKKE